MTRIQLFLGACVLVVLTTSPMVSNAWIIITIQQNHGPFLSTKLTTATPTRTTRRALTSLMALPPNYKQVGEDLIWQAASTLGIGATNSSKDELEIQWIQSPRAKIVVTVNGKAFLSSNPEDEDEDDVIMDYDDNNDGNEEEGYDYDFNEEQNADMQEEEEELFDGETTTTATSEAVHVPVDVVELARAINTVLDQDEVGSQIAQVYGIDVTTPGASDELQGIMWNAYQGFDVICTFVDVTKQQKSKNEDKTTKTIQGRLHGRDDETTTINVKGRLKTIANENVVSVKLPPAKKEK